MNKYNYKVGDRIIVLNSDYETVKKGDTGVITLIVRSPQDKILGYDVNGLFFLFYEIIPYNDVTKILYEIDNEE